MVTAPVTPRSLAKASVNPSPMSSSPSEQHHAFTFQNNSNHQFSPSHTDHTMSTTTSSTTTTTARTSGSIINLMNSNNNSNSNPNTPNNNNNNNNNTSNNSNTIPYKLGSSMNSVSTTVRFWDVVSYGLHLHAQQIDSDEDDMDSSSSSNNNNNQPADEVVVVVDNSKAKPRKFVSDLQLAQHMSRLLNHFYTPWADLAKADTTNTPHAHVDPQEWSQVLTLRSFVRYFKDILRLLTLVQHALDDHSISATEIVDLCVGMYKARGRGGAIGTVGLQTVFSFYKTAEGSGYDNNKVYILKQTNHCLLRAQ